MLQASLHKDHEIDDSLLVHEALTWDLHTLPKTYMDALDTTLKLHTGPKILPVS